MVCSRFAVYVLAHNTRFVPYFELCMVVLDRPDTKMSLVHIFSLI